MKITKVTAVYFSPAGSTQKVVCHIASTIANALDVPVEDVDFTLPAGRQQSRHFGPEDLVVFGTPTYAGRIPNKALPFVQNLFSAEGTPAIAAVTWGNRSFDSSLTELVQELDGHGFLPFAAGAFVCRHVFSDALAGGRPNEEDLAFIADFAGKAAEKVLSASEAADLSAPVQITGRPEVLPYYKPLEADGSPANFLKAKPVTDMEKCTKCGICAAVCPLGSVDPDDFSKTPGICIKCHACIRKCPENARYFDDPSLISHRKMIVTHYAERKESAVFI